MKEFEKWLKDDAKKVLPIATDYYHLITIEDAAEKAWKAALEWGKNLVERLGQDALWDIEEELKDE